MRNPLSVTDDELLALRAAANGTLVASSSAYNYLCDGKYVEGRVISGLNSRGLLVGVTLTAVGQDAINAAQRRS